VRLAGLKVDNPLVLAPMAGFSDLAFRLTAKDCGAGLVYTEMISSEGLLRRDPKTWSLLRSHPTERPLVVQLFGGRAETLAQAAGLVEAAGFEAIDLNLGCPVKKVLRQGAGAALLRDLDLVRRIFRAVRGAVRLPLLAKLRSGFSPAEGEVATRVARLAEDEGLDGLVLHPRFARQGFSGRADWTLLERVAKAVSLPLIGSGDAIRPEDGAAMLATGCAGVMVGRAALGRPWIFGQMADHLAGRPVRPPSLETRLWVMRRHLNLLVHYQGRRAAWLKFKGLFGHYAKGLPQARAIRRRIHLSGGLSEMEDLIDDYFNRLRAGTEAA